MDPRQIEYGDGGAEKLLAWEANGHGQHVSLLRSLVGAPGAAICAGFAAVPERDPEKLLWETDLFAAVAALHLNDAGGFASMLRGGLYDSLTGCLTYGGLMHAIEAEIARSERRGHWL